MRYSNEIIERARKLRSRGKTYSEIFKVLGIKVPKSTISTWCKNVKLPLWYQEKIDSLNHMNLTKGQKMALISHNKMRREVVKGIFSKNQHFVEITKDKNIMKLALSFLYLGEGAKWKSHRGLHLGSSDPVIVRLYLRLLRYCYGLLPQNLHARICYRADQDIEFLHRYWSQITSIPLKNFYKTKPDPRTVGKPTKKKGYRGVCAIICSGTHIQLELESIPKIILGSLRPGM